MRTCPKCNESRPDAGFGTHIRWCQPSPELFWSKVNKDGPNGCWLWTGAKNQFGYGLLQRKRIMLRAHRVSLEWARGEAIPAHLDVLHTCDVRDCVNPAHLFVGTHQENMDDMTSKGRRRWTGGPRLDAERAAELRRLRAEGWKLSDLQARFNISNQAVSRICNNRTYRDAGRG
jgi:hypothetical protein